MDNQSRIEEIIREAESFPIYDICELVERLNGIIDRNKAMELEKVFQNRLHTRADIMIAKMNSLVGGDITSKSRKPSFVWGRYMVAYQLMTEGCRLGKIGRILNRDRTTVIHMIAEMRVFLEFPLQYIDEMDIWKEFQEFIRNLQ